jgi:hypothetical protein
MAFENADDFTATIREFFSDSTRFELIQTFPAGSGGFSASLRVHDQNGGSQRFVVKCPSIDDNGSI